MAVLFTVGEHMNHTPVSASEIAVDQDVVAIDDESSDVLGEEEPVDSGSLDTAMSDMSGLFEDTGDETVVRKGETLEEARIEDEPLSGSGDGGSTINIGHLYVINGVTVRNSDFPSQVNECWAYANDIYAKIWGHNFWSEFYDTENMLRNLSDEELTLTPEHLKAYVSAAPAGSALRVCNADYLHGNDIGGHSQVIIAHDEDGFTVFEGGLSAYPHRREAYYTWTGYCYSGWPGRYQYIKYIKWPGAEPYSENMVGVNAQDLGVSELDQFQEQAAKTLQEFLTLAGDVIVGKKSPKALRKWKNMLIQAAKESGFGQDETESELPAETESELPAETESELPDKTGSELLFETEMQDSRVHS